MPRRPKWRRALRFRAISMMTMRCDIISVSYTSERKSFVSAVAAMLDGRNDNADISPDRSRYGRRHCDPRGALSVENAKLEANDMALFAAMTRTLHPHRRSR